MLKRAVVVGVILAFGLLGFTEHGEAISVSCLDLGGGSCTGTLAYDSATHILEIHLLNDGVGNFHALGIETPGDQTADSLAAGSEAGWVLSTTTGNFGLGASWDAAAGTQGKDSNPVTPGNTLDLFFHLIGSGLDTLTAGDFVAASNKTGGCGDILAWGCVHVQSLPEDFNGSDSVKLPLQANGVPEPMTLLLLGAGLLGTVALGRRLRK